MTYHLAIAAIFKNETPYLEEWLEYHLLVGFDHFYLYDNDGSNEVRELLAPYFRAGIVSHHPFTWINGTRHDRPTPFGGREREMKQLEAALQRARRGEAPRRRHPCRESRRAPEDPALAR